MRRFLVTSAALLLMVLGPQAVLAQYQPSGTLAVSTGNADPGSQVTVSGTGFAPGSSVQISIASTPVLLATVTTDNSGALSAKVTIPATLSGAQTITATGTDPAGSVRVLSNAITVTAAPATNTALFALAGAGVVVMTGLLLLGTRTWRSRR